jgi:hypothetical protein
MERIIVINTAGQVVMTQFLPENTRQWPLDLTQVINKQTFGVYFVKIEGAYWSTTQPIVVQP